jgi:diguanylate cyclase (GGDEF)-like protein
MAALLAAYLGSLIVRSPDQRSTLVDGWLVASFELGACLLCFARAITWRRDRAVPMVLGCALLAWAIGDYLLTGESLGGEPPSPSLADAFYLCFYPLAYVALVLFMRRGLGRLRPTTWLDGLVAGLGAAAVVAAFAFNTIVQTAGGESLGVATNLAYPVGDLLLLALAVAGTAILPERRKASWILLAGACAINGVGDTFNLFHSTVGASQVGVAFDSMAWPTAILLISASVWLRPPHQRRFAPARTPGFFLPGLASLAGLVILFFATLHHIDRTALALATATLATAGLRLGLSVHSLRMLTEERRQQAVTDELTGLGNRRQLTHILDAFFAVHAHGGSADQRLAFLFVDLDHFKEINDSFGHAAGDQLLKQLGPRLRGALRSSDVLVRVGGDELAVLLIDTDRAYALTVAQRLMAKLEEPFQLDAVNVRIGASIGIAIAPTDATDSAGLMRCADLAMYRAKASDTRFQLYEQEIDDAGNRLLLVEELRAAVHDAQLTLHYQPQVDLRTGDITAVEALLRWPHDRLGLVPPLQFLPLAEEAGLMPALTALVLEQALTQCSVWRGDGHDLAVSVNVSATNLLDPGFVDVIALLLARHRLPAAALILEITETTIIGDFDACRRVIAQLRERGICVSIDDFRRGVHLARVPRQSRGWRGEARSNLHRRPRQRGDGARSDTGARHHRAWPRARPARRR